MNLKNVLKMLMIVVLSLIAADQGWSQPEISTTHALAMTGTPKYARDYKHFGYANPDAPKGGEIKLGTVGTFDSLNPFIIRGVPAAGIGLMYDTLTDRSLDEPFTQYGLIAAKIELPEDFYSDRQSNCMMVGDDKVLFANSIQRGIFMTNLNGTFLWHVAPSRSFYRAYYMENFY